VKKCEEWCSKQLAKVGAAPCERLAEHFVDGVALADLVSALTGRSLKVNRKPKMTAHKMDNIDVCLKVIATLPKYKVEVTPIGLHEGDLGIITPFIMKLVKYFDHNALHPAATEPPQHVSSLWQQAQAVRPGNPAYTNMRAQLDADLAATEEAYRLDKEREAAAQRAEAQRTGTLVGLRASEVEDEQLAYAKSQVYTSTRGLQVGGNKYLTASKLAKPTIATWMTLPDGPERAASKAELAAYKGTMADREERALHGHRAM